MRAKVNKENFWEHSGVITYRKKDYVVIYEKGKAAEVLGEITRGGKTYEETPIKERANESIGEKGTDFPPISLHSTKLERSYYVYKKIPHKKQDEVREEYNKQQQI